MRDGDLDLISECLSEFKAYVLARESDTHVIISFYDSIERTEDALARVRRALREDASPLSETAA